METPILHQCSIVQKILYKVIAPKGDGCDYRLHVESEFLRKTRGKCQMPVPARRGIAGNCDVSKLEGKMRDISKPHS
ncbi:hypothetical protein [Nostoc sp. KVJ20]|uniref:hypothetical protein n=1 Tax=Nostoc sp. KVJ20 TaxID=457944 RepID=UPI00114D2281|nr:hypothetical protein [Nostoc sp. KVJ20]